MAITVVLRLMPGPLESGELVGHVEHVPSGIVEPIRGAAEIVDFVRRALTAAVEQGSVDIPDQAEGGHRRS